jgi:hypothetical protein
MAVALTRSAGRLKPRGERPVSRSIEPIPAASSKGEGRGGGALATTVRGRRMIVRSRQGRSTKRHVKQASTRVSAMTATVSVPTGARPSSSREHDEGPMQR